MIGCLTAQRAETLFFDNVPVDKIGIKASSHDDYEDDDVGDDYEVYYYFYDEVNFNYNFITFS